MVTKTQAQEVLLTLQMLPSDKVAEVFDYLAFLRERYARSKPVDVSDAWSDEDVSDLVVASLNYTVGASTWSRPYP
jgi:hypothetical protein